MRVLNAMTSVSREYNLPRILHSLKAAVAGTGFVVRWIQVFDAPGPQTSYGSKLDGEGGDVEAARFVFRGQRSVWAVAQKNFGMDQMVDGFYVCLDDDNVLHPNFIRVLERAVTANPDRKAFVVGQRRWDTHGNIPAIPGNVRPGFIDSAQFIIHSSLIGPTRYDQAYAGQEDGRFVSEMYARAPGEFVFVDEIASYFNYLRVE